MYNSYPLRVDTSAEKKEPNNDENSSKLEDNNGLSDIYSAIRSDNADRLRACLEKQRPHSAGSHGEMKRKISGKRRDPDRERDRIKNINISTRLAQLFEYAKQNQSQKCLSYLRETHSWAEATASSSFLPQITIPSPQHKASHKKSWGSHHEDTYKLSRKPSTLLSPKTKQRFKNQAQQLQRRAKAFKRYYFERNIASRMPTSERMQVSLQSACTTGKVAVVREILVSLAKIRSESQPNTSKLMSALCSTNDLYETPLHIACKSGHTSIVEQLLAVIHTQDDETKRGLVIAPDFGGYAPLHRAAQNGHADCISLLLHAKANIDQSVARRHAPPQPPTTPPSITAQLPTAPTSAQVGAGLGLGGAPVSAGGSSKATPSRAATPEPGGGGGGDITSVEGDSTGGGKSLHYIGKTALIIAATGGHATAVKTLITHGVSHAFGGTVAAQDHPLCLVCRTSPWCEGHAHVAKALATYTAMERHDHLCSVRMKQCYLDAALLQVVLRWGRDDMSSSWGVVQSLLQAGANPLANSGLTPQGVKVNLSSLAIWPDPPSDNLSSRKRAKKGAKGGGKDAEGVTRPCIHIRRLVRIRSHSKGPAWCGLYWLQPTLWCGYPHWKKVGVKNDPPTHLYFYNTMQGKRGGQNSWSLTKKNPKGGSKDRFEGGWTEPSKRARGCCKCLGNIVPHPPTGRMDWNTQWVDLTLTSYTPLMASVEHCAPELCRTLLEAAKEAYNREQQMAKMAKRQDTISLGGGIGGGTPRPRNKLNAAPGRQLRRSQSNTFSLVRNEVASALKASNKKRQPYRLQRVRVPARARTRASLSAQWAAHPLGWLDPEPSPPSVTVTHMGQDLRRRRAAEEMYFQASTALDFLRAHQHGGPYGAVAPQRRSKDSGTLLLTALMDNSPSTALPALMALPYVDPNSLSSENLSGNRQSKLLLAAVESGKADVVRWLFAHPGVDINSGNVLRAAITSKHPDLVNVVMQALDEDLPDLDVKSSDLIWAVWEGEVGLCRRLLERPHIGINEDVNGGTPLMYAVANKSEASVTFLMGMDGIELNKQINGGVTALMRCCGREGNADMMRRLLEAPREQLDVNLTDDTGRTALMRAAENGFDDRVRILLEQPGIAVNARTKGGVTALMFAVKENNSKCVQALLEAQDIDVNQFDSDPLADVAKGRTALMYAAWQGALESIRVLLSHSKLDVNAVDEFGSTALMYASKYSTGAVELLLRHSDVQIDSTGLSAAHCEYSATSLAQENNPSAVPLLLKRADQVEALAVLPLVLLCLQRVDPAIMSAAETRVALASLMGVRVPFEIVQVWEDHLP